MNQVGTRNKPQEVNKQNPKHSEPHRSAGLCKLDFKLIQEAIRQMDTGTNKYGGWAFQKVQTHKLTLTDKL